MPLQPNFSENENLSHPKPKSGVVVILCMALSGQSPSRTPLFCTCSATGPVMFTKRQQPGNANQRYSVCDFMRQEVYHAGTDLETAKGPPKSSVASAKFALQVQGIWGGAAAPPHPILVGHSCRSAEILHCNSLDGIA